MLDETRKLSKELLYNRFLLMKGFEDTPLGILKQYSIQKNQFIQNIYDKNHWETIHADRATDAWKVYLFDSLQKAKFSDLIVKQLFEIRKCSYSIFKIVSMTVQQQLIAFDCASFASDLVYGKDPAVWYYDTNKMRNHMLHSL